MLQLGRVDKLFSVFAPLCVGQCRPPHRSRCVQFQAVFFCLARANATNVCTQMSRSIIDLLYYLWHNIHSSLMEMQFRQFISHVKPVYCCALHTAHILRPLYICFTLLPRGQEFAALCRLPSCRLPCTDYQVVDCRVQIAVCLCIAAVCGAFSHGQFKPYSLLLRLVMVISQLWDLNSSQLIQSTTVFFVNNSFP